MPRPQKSKPFPDHANSLTRLRRIAGQIKGIERMVDERRYCIEILQQVTAARRALDEVALQIVRGHVNSCVTDAIRTRSDGTAKVEELIRTIHRFIRR